MIQDKLLLLSCCAPCSVGVIHQLHEQRVDFTVLFYNPNIQPENEYVRRRDENKRICLELHVPFIELEYRPDLWKEATKGFENGFTRFSSVLGISRFKDFDQVCRAAQKASEEEHIPYDATNWRKNGGLERAERLAKEKNLYRQTYCGCHPR